MKDSDEPHTFEGSESSLLAGWNLKLLNKVSHEPLTVRHRVKVVMTDTLNVYAHSFGGNLRDVL